MVTIGELHLFHSMDREIFARLVITLKRPPSQTLLIMALFLWLENAKQCKIIHNLSKISNNLLDAIANEGALCINCLKSKSPTIHGGTLTLMSTIIGQETTLKTISQSKYTTISGVKSYLSEICTWIFTDILLQVLTIPSNFNFDKPLIIHGFPNPTFGSLEIYVLPMNYTIPSKGNWGWKLKFEAPIDDRTLFLTFSRGFPVSEMEAKMFFTEMCGDCIENFEMEAKNDPKVQCLYARMELKCVSYMDQIMNGKYIAKFRNSSGKHIWARKFERRDHRLMRQNHPA